MNRNQESKRETRETDAPAELESQFILRMPPVSKIKPGFEPIMKIVFVIILKITKSTSKTV